MCDIVSWEFPLAMQPDWTEIPSTAARTAKRCEKATALIH